MAFLLSADLLGRGRLFQSRQHCRPQARVERTTTTCLLGKLAVVLPPAPAQEWHTGEWLPAIVVSRLQGRTLEKQDPPPQGRPP